MMCSDPYVKRVVLSPGMVQDEYYPCGNCVECLANRARVWKTRILLEASSHKENCFVTLTIAPEMIEHDITNFVAPLYKRSIQLFMKRLRRKYADRIRYFFVGEYGDNTYRPHYHGILFGIGSKSKALIESAWRLNGESIGFVSIGDVCPKTAGYVTGYISKGEKIGGKKIEWMVCSTKPGTGS